MQKTSILIVDDHTLVRETWSFILNNHPNFTVVGEARSGEEGIEQAKTLHPDVVIMDINLPQMNGIEAAEQISKCSPISKVLGVSLHIQPTYARKLMQRGAKGYVTKTSTREEMFLAISEVQKGNKYICKEIKEILSEQMFEGKTQNNAIHKLSQREIEISSLISKGYTSKEIADTLYISARTVEVHRYNILKKLNLKNAAALVNLMNSNQLGLAV